jgi:dihydrofolate reductase
MEQSEAQISIIVAMAENRVIGRNNDLPWRLSADLRHFKALTVGKPIIMGRKTWESLPGLLPDRTHIIVTSDPDYRAEGCRVVHTLEEAVRAAGDVPEVMVIGGAMLYGEAIPRAARIYLTEVHAEVEGDVLFPEFRRSDWRELERERFPADEKNPLPFSFVVLERYG